MYKQPDRYNNNDETRSQRSIGRRSVGTANTARSVIDLDKALAQIYAEFGADTEHEEIAGTLYEAGLANYGEQNYSKAPDHLILALNMYRNLQAESDEEDLYESEMADILKTLGMVYLARYELDKARQDHHKANKELEKARNHFKQALIKKRNIYGETVINTDITELERYLGLTYLSEICSSEKTETALTHLTSALEQLKSIYGEDTVHLEIADTYWHLGRAYQQQKDYDQARAQFTAALAMYQEIYSESNHAKIAGTYYKIGFTYLAVGNHNKAISSFTKAFDIYTQIRQTNPTIDLNYVDLCFQLGQAYSLVNAFDKAVPHLENAWIMYQALYRSSNPKHPLILAAEQAMTQNKQKREGQSNAGPRQYDPTVSEQKLSAASQVPVELVNRTVLTSKVAAKQNSSTITGNKELGKQKSPQSTSSIMSMFSQPLPVATVSASSTITVREVKAYYVSKAGLFNASKKIFVTEDLDQTLQELRKRAEHGGASAATLAHFGLSLK